ncbi:hypothetical protein AMECASPLE_005408, partial [Ameca splendens]
GESSGETYLLSKPCPPFQRTPFCVSLPAAEDLGRLFPHTPGCVPLPGGPPHSLHQWVSSPRFPFPHPRRLVKQ